MTSHHKDNIVVGIFAIQGAVEEHAVAVKKCGAAVKEIRMPQDFEGVDGIILPGGESTTMAIVGERWGLFPKLREWVADKKPIWGTCAGMILLSDHAIKQAEGGQSLVGGLDVRVCRNYFGSQIHSCIVDINIDQSPPEGSSTMEVVKDDHGVRSGTCNAVFIRAPAILSAGPEVRILASIAAKPHVSAKADVVRVIEEAVASAAANDALQSMSISKDDASLTSSSSSSLTHRARVSQPVPRAESNSSSSSSGGGGSGSSSSSSSSSGSSSVISVAAEDEDQKYEVFVAVQQGNILATAFHPELTNDTRWHKHFLDMITKSKS